MGIDDIRARARAEATDEKIDALAEQIKGKTPEQIDEIVDQVAAKAKELN